MYKILKFKLSMCIHDDNILVPMYILCKGTTKINMKYNPSYSSCLKHKFIIRPTTTINKYNRHLKQQLYIIHISIRHQLFYHS